VETEEELPDGVATTVDELGLAVSALAQAPSTKLNPAESSDNLTKDLTMDRKVTVAKMAAPGAPLARGRGGREGRGARGQGGEGSVGPALMAACGEAAAYPVVVLGPADDLGRGPVVFAQKWWGKGFEAAAPEQGSWPAGAFTH
jgi:hypothetical protein